MLKDGDFSHAELMMGTNQDEGKLVKLYVNIFSIFNVYFMYSVKVHTPSLKKIAMFFMQPLFRSTVILYSEKIATPNS